MKKVFGIFLLFLIVFVMSGCNKAIEGNNVMDVNYIEVRDENDVIYNVSSALKELKVMSFVANVEVKGKEYVFDGKVVSGGTIEDSVININYKDNSLYIKEGIVYISYKFNNTNVIVKDTLDNFIEEIISFLENKGIKCNEQKIYDFIKNKTLSDINLEKLSLLVEMGSNEYSVDYKNVNINLNKYFLPEKIDFQNDKYSVNVDFSYDKVSISIPIGFDLITLSIANIKNLLRVDNIINLIK